MNQLISNFEINFINSRTKEKTTIVNDSSFVDTINIHKDISLNNVVSISFVKNKAYENASIGNYLSLFNYVKIKIELTNSDESVPQKYYFSGFIVEINEVDDLGERPMFAVVVTVSDFSHLLKTTFYSKNLTFLDILAQAIPEFRLLNFNEIFFSGKKDPRGDAMISQFYTPSQMGFVLFMFFTFKFFVKMIENNEVEIKPFRIFLPFCFGVESKFATQAMSLLIYKQFQSNSMELFKYLFPEPFFEFNVLETESSVNLIIRPSPLLAYDNTDYKVIEVPEFDFGLSVIDSSDPNAAVVINQKIRDWQSLVINYIEGKNGGTENLKSIGSNLAYSSLSDFMSSDQDAKIIAGVLYKEKYLDVKKIASISSRKSSSSVVNLIWTVATTDTSLIRATGRGLVYGNFEELILDFRGSPQTHEEFRLNHIETDKRYKEGINWYLSAQYSIMKPYSNPMIFLPPDGNATCPGDIRIFGLREFEARWNMFNIVDFSVFALFKNLNDKSFDILRELASKGDPLLLDKVLLLQKDTKNLDTSESSIKPTGRKKALRQQKILNDLKSKTEAERVQIVAQQIINSPTSKVDPSAINRTSSGQKIIQTPSVAVNRVKTRDDSWNEIMTSIDKDFGVQMLKIFQYHQGMDFKSLLVGTPAEIKSKLRLVGDKFVKDFASGLNNIIGFAYKDNEKISSASIKIPIDLSVVQGQILTTYVDNVLNSNEINLKGYVVGVTHSINFNSGLFMTTVELNRVNKTYAS